MRSLSIAAIAAFLVFVIPAANAQQYCVGNCDLYSDPVYHDQTGYGDDMRYPPGHDDETWAVSPNPPSIDGPYVGQPPIPDYRAPRTHRPRYRKRRYRTVRRHHKKRYQRPVYRDRLAGRTEFCREHIERRGHDWGSRKVKVRRCIWVRNDLVPNYAEGGRYSSDW